ncbi:MAG: glycoside hydrolase family 3 C-terminal domain-containing protein [Henriciella sp.]|nr:glycoside hydrolase family 3 C-terminal domain-containing protein [Henriciella sp.]
MNGQTTTRDFSPQKGLSEQDIEDLISEILEEATLEEKVGMMSGRGFFESMARTGGVWGAEPYRAGGGIDRLGVPALYFTDGPRGVARGNSTCFPCTMARGASWERDLERRIGEVMGMEARAQDCNLSGAVCVNLLRHPGWGRAQETYGEDPYHMGELGAALSTGIQTHNVVATVKHYALNSIENARFKVNVKISDRDLREVYLPHFKRILDAGCASVMSAYNKMNGEYCGQHRELLTDILRHEWGFDGFVHSDWMLGVYAPYGASAGLDVENPEPLQYGQNLVDAVNNRQIEPSVIETACRRILRVTYRFACAQDPFEDYPIDLVAREDNRAIALEAAENSAVLLKNNGVLPLDKSKAVGVFGTLADLENTGDHGSSKVMPPYVITPLKGIADYLGSPDLKISGSETDVDAAAAAAKDLDAAIIVVGTTADHEGEWIPGDIGAQALFGEGAQIPEGLKQLMSAMAEQREKQNKNAGALGGGGNRGGDRERLRLPDDQIALVKAVTAVNPNTIVVIVSGSAILSPDWGPQTGAILQTFYAGMKGGTALAKLLYGAISPSGKLPFSVADDESAYPFFDKDAEEIEYGSLHGYTLFEKNQTRASFAFGHGLSYSEFSYRGLKARRAPGGIQAQVSITNIGSVPATEVAQLYIGFPGKSVERPLKLLRGFERVPLAPSETRTVEFFVPDADLSYWSESGRTWILEPGAHAVMAGGSSLDETLLSVSVAI